MASDLTTGRLVGLKTDGLWVSKGATVWHHDKRNTPELHCTKCSLFAYSVHVEYFTGAEKVTVTAALDTTRDEE